MSLEVLSKSAVLLHIPEEHGKSVHVIAGEGDGPLITIDAAGHIKVSPNIGPGDPEVRKAISGIVQGIQSLARIATEGKSAAAGH